jgi:hypothetical protein
MAAERPSARLLIRRHQYPQEARKISTERILRGLATNYGTRPYFQTSLHGLLTPVTPSTTPDRASTASADRANDRVSARTRALENRRRADSQRGRLFESLDETTRYPIVRIEPCARLLNSTAPKIRVPDRRRHKPRHDPAPQANSIDRVTVADPALGKPCLEKTPNPERTNGGIHERSRTL